MKMAAVIKKSCVYRDSEWTCIKMHKKTSANMPTFRQNNDFIEIYNAGDRTLAFRRPYIRMAGDRTPGWQATVH